MEIQASHALMKICVRAAIIWIVSMLLAIPEAVFSDLHPFHDKGTNKTFVSCAPYPHSDGLHPKIHSMASFLIFYIIPLSVISVYYYFIAKNLIRSAYNIPVEGNMHVRKQVETWPSSKIHIPCESGSKKCGYREIYTGTDCICCANFNRLGGLKELKWLTQAMAQHWTVKVSSVSKFRDFGRVVTMANTAGHPFQSLGRYWLGCRERGRAGDGVWRL